MNTVPDLSDPITLRHYLLRASAGVEPKKAFVLVIQLLIAVGVLLLALTQARPMARSVGLALTVLPVASPSLRFWRNLRRHKSLLRLLNAIADHIRHNGVAVTDALIATRGFLISTERYFQGCYSVADTTTAITLEFDGQERESDQFRLRANASTDKPIDFGVWPVAQLDEVIAVAEVAVPNARFSVSAGVLNSPDLHRSDVTRSTLARVWAGTKGNVVWVPSEVLPSLQTATSEVRMDDRAHVVNELRRIERDPHSIRAYRSQTLDMQLLAVQNDPESLKYINTQAPEAVDLAIHEDPKMIVYANKPTLNQLYYVYGHITDDSNVLPQDATAAQVVKHVIGGLLSLKILFL